MPTEEEKPATTGDVAPEPFVLPERFKKSISSLSLDRTSVTIYAIGLQDAALDLLEEANREGIIEKRLEMISCSQRVNKIAVALQALATTM